MRIHEWENVSGIMTQLRSWRMLVVSNVICDGTPTYVSIGKVITKLWCSDH